MRGGDQLSGKLFSYVDLESRVPGDHPLRAIREIVNDVLVGMSDDFSAMYAPMGRPSIPPERLLRALLLQAFYSIRSERQLMEQLDFNLLFRWFVGLGMDDQVWARAPSATIAIASCRRMRRRGFCAALSNTRRCAACSVEATSRSMAP